MIRISVHWGKTGLRLKEVLYERVGLREMADVMGISSSSLENKLNGENLTIEDFVFFSRISGEPIENLLIFEEDEGRDPSDFPDDSSYVLNPDRLGADCLEDFYRDKQKFVHQLPIRTLWEFLLYVPLFSHENLSFLQNYLRMFWGRFESREDCSQLYEDLYAMYQRIPASLAKQYADRIRDDYLRNKFTGSQSLTQTFNVAGERKSYMLNLTEEASLLSKEKVSHCGNLPSEEEGERLLSESVSCIGNIGLSPDEQRVVKCLISDPTMSTVKIANALDMKLHHTDKIMKSLKEKGVVSYKGRGRAVYWEVYMENDIVDKT